MSKLFFKGRIETRQNHVKSGYNVKAEKKAGTAGAPIAVRVNSKARQIELDAILTEQGIIGNITVDAQQAENTSELDALLNKPKTTRVEKTANRNDPCVCGSGKKYKKCCA